MHPPRFNSFVGKQRMLLEIEYNADKAEHLQQMEQRGLDRLAKRGDAWVGVSFSRSYYNSLNQFSVELLRTQDQEVEHNFEFGRPVLISNQEAVLGWKWESIRIYIRIEKCSILAFRELM